MSKENNLTEFLTDLADAIREKKGTSEKINPQDFSEEIRSIEGGGNPFAVDFGEEIATGNPSFIGALQEDIDYYNEVQRRRAAGEVTDAVLAKEPEFRDKIVWWPKGMSGNNYVVKYRDMPYKKLRAFNFPELVWDGYYLFEYSTNIEEVEFTINSGGNCNRCFQYCANLKKAAIHGVIKNADSMFQSAVSLEEVAMDVSAVTSAKTMFYTNYRLKDISLSFDSLSNTLSGFLQNCRCENLTINLPNVTILDGAFRECEVRDTLYLNIPKVNKVLYSLFYNNSSYYSLGKNVYISGLMVSMSLGFLGAKNVSAESIKYILENCQAREDGAGYTLTLHADVKARFMAKCTEGSEEYDAEYASALVSANEKGLTLA